MARNRDPFTQALSSLRERIHSGHLTGGSPIIVQDEAVRLRLSTTPIREALARLSGEGLVERAASGGYVVGRTDATAARDRYAMRGHYVRLACEKNQRQLGGAVPPPPPFEPAASSRSIATLFTTLVCSAGNQVLWEAFQKVSGQLAVFQSVEALVFEDLDQEAHALFHLYASEGPAGFLAGVSRYHERRVAASGVLAALAVHGRHRPAAEPAP